MGHFEKFRGLLNTFSKKWRILFRNVRFLKDIFREVKVFLNGYEYSLKLTRLFEDIAREMEASV
jgi:hypothetical protein